jgi:hypothetical protein
MSNGVGAYLLPKRLPAISDRWYAWLRPLWVLTLAFAIVCVIGGTAYVVHETNDTEPVFIDVGLNVDSIELKRPVVSPFSDEATLQGIADDSVVLGIDGEALPRGTDVETIAKRLKAAPGPIVTLQLRDPESHVGTYRLTRSKLHRQVGETRQALGRDTQNAIRLGSSLLACIALLVGAMMLGLRRPRDPVAMLLSFSFLLFAATIDPPMAAWLSLGYETAYEIVGTAAWLLVILGLAGFPDGRFIPRWLNWIVPLMLPIAIFLSLDSVDATLQLAVGLAIPLVLVALWWPRYRRLDEQSIERQQIKWAAFGFFAGFLLIGLTVAAAIRFGDENSSTANLMLVTGFSIGFALLPLGLMISLIRFRLWEADVVITRSAAYALVTVTVGVVWAATSDFVKEAVFSMVGEHNSTIATSLSAILAAGLFAPSQALVLRWTKKRFANASSKLHTMTQRLPAWSASASPAELGMRALAAIAESVHPGRAAVLALTPTGNQLLASRGIDDPETIERATPEWDPRFPMRLSLEDDDGPVGTLLLGPRSDGNRYNRDEREAIETVIEPLAVAIRHAQGRLQREEDSMQRMLGMVEERLRQIEGGFGGAGPATA